ncbi:phage portal protein family protein [Epibacterium ulvae]|uniref:phage portal protein family protein n=1 Tax=Epibacterium ulvae TaxID=1156985 RepID=UPI0024914C20|nr:DUF935 family protein [Epibacterium ulvae]
MAKRKKAARSVALNTGGAIATVGNDITIANYSDILHPLDDTLIERGGGAGLKIYDQIERDTHAYAVLQKRKHKLVGREWVVEAGGTSAEDEAAADFIRDQLNILPFDQICLDLLDATLKGFSIGEPVYTSDGRHTVAEKITSLEQRRFVFDDQWQPRLLTTSEPLRGEKLPKRKFIVHRFGVKGNNPYGLGMGTRLFWPVLFKRNGVAYWQRFLERFASPIPVGYYPVGTSLKQQASLQRTLEMMNHASAIRVPLGTQLDTFESSRSGTSDYGNWGKFWNTEISKGVLGETLTTEMGATGARAASETHQDILDALVDSDADLLSGTLNAGVIRWLCAFNYPNAAPPRVWRPRPSNELQQEQLKKARAERRSAQIKALNDVRTAGYEPADMDGYMGDVLGVPVVAVKADAAGGVKKNSNDVSFADRDLDSLSVSEVQSAFEASVAKVHRRWISELKALATAATSEDQFLIGLLEWQSKQAVPEYAPWLGDALALAELIGRGEVLDEIAEEEGAALAEPQIGTQRFEEGHEFLRQKVSLPTKRWTETLHQAHDRAFVVAGADSVALVEDLRTALTKAIDGGGGLEAFRKGFDKIVEQRGWDYAGGRNWRTRVIYETNLRSMHQAGRLKQMRDPDVVKLRPYWRYIHGETRTPKNPREQHKSWDGLILLHDDPTWQIIYPQNGWRCSCGVGTVSRAGLRRLGKTGPDKTPTINMRKIKDPITQQWTYVPEGIDYGFGYAPGDTWERGIVPREWQKPLSMSQPELPLPVSPSLEDLGRPFAAPKLTAGRDPEYYAERFLSKFGATIDQAVVHRDQAGHALLISDALFKNADGRWKVTKFGREVDIERLAEAIFDPDEIWVDWVTDPRSQDPILVRRYLRWHSDLSAYASFEWGSVGWSGKTVFPPTKGRKQRPDRNYLERHRRGALLYRRER